MRDRAGRRQAPSGSSISIRRASVRASDGRAAPKSLAPPVVRSADLFDVSRPLSEFPPVKTTIGREGIFEPELQ